MAAPGEHPGRARQLSAGPGVCVYVETNQPGEAGPSGVLDRRAGSRDAVTSLYAEHAVGLIRLAVVMIGDRPAAEEIVQDAFCGLYRRWDRISDRGKALGYVRAAVLNGCRSALRRRVRAPSAPRTRAVVRATATGAVLATIIPPRPYGTFVGVAAAGDDRTFVLGAQQDGNIPASGLGSFPATRFFLLRIDPASASASGRVTLAPLPIPAVPASTQLYNFALSPQGTSLALLVEQGIQVFNVTTGAERTWEIPVPGTKLHSGLGGYFALGAGATDEMLAWGGTHTLAWIYYGGPPAGGAASGAGIRLLDTRARGSNLLTDSRLVVPQPKDIADPGSYWRQALPTVAGRAIFAVLELTGRSGLRQELAEYSARTGRLLLVLNHVRIHGNYEQVLWASLSGHSLVVSGVGRSPGSGYPAGVGVLTGGHFKPIPWPGQNFAAAW